MSDWIAPPNSIAIIVATDLNGCMAKAGTIPWRCSEDLKDFKRKTMGKPIIMGRATFESIGKPLPGRDNIVISRRMAPRDDITLVDSPERAVAAAVESAGDGEIMVIGGWQIYEYFMKELRVDRIYLNVIPTEVEDGDLLFRFEKHGPWAMRSHERRPEFESYLFELDPPEEDEIVRFIEDD